MSHFNKDFYSHFYKALLISISCIVIFSCLELVIAFLIQSFLIFIGSGTVPTSNFLFTFLPSIGLREIYMGLILVALAKFLVEFVMHLTNSKVNYRSIYVLRERLFTYFTTSPNYPPSKANHLNGVVFTNTGLFMSLLNRFISFGVFTFFLLLFMAFISWKQALLCLVLTLIVGIISWWVSKKIKTYASLIPIHNDRISKLLQKISRSLFFIHVSDMQDEEVNHLQKKNTKIFHAAIKSEKYAALGASITPFLGMLIIASIFASSEKMFGEQIINVVPFLYLFMRYIQTLTSCINYLSQLLPLKPFYLEAMNFYNAKPPLDDNKKGANKTPYKGPIDIRVTDVSFAYGDHSILQNANMHIPKGQFTALIGESGVGKSTFFSLLLQFLSPSSGTIEFNETPYEKFYQDHQCKIGYVGAEPYLFSGTLKENLCYGIRESISGEEIQNALTSVSMSSFASDDFLETNIDEHLSNFSAGQKQRLCLARAILTKPSILLLDEFSSNLDSQTEKVILENLKELTKDITTISISHRTSVLEYADCVYVLKDKTIYKNKT